MIPDFTPRELELLKMIARGFRLEEIARRWVNSPQTVRNLSQKVYRKISVDNRGAAMRWAYQHGYAPKEIIDENQDAADPSRPQSQHPQRQARL